MHIQFCLYCRYLSTNMFSMRKKSGCYIYYLITNLIKTEGTYPSAVYVRAKLPITGWYSCSSSCRSRYDVTLKPHYDSQSYFRRRILTTSTWCTLKSFKDVAESVQSMRSNKCRLSTLKTSVSQTISNITLLLHHHPEEDGESLLPLPDSK